MLNIDVLFLIEHVDRELDAAACIVEMLESRFAISADIRNFYSDMLYSLNRYQPAILVTPFCYFLDHHPMKDYAAAWPDALFFNLAWEQILYKMNEAVKIPKDSFARSRVHHVCWTKKYRDFVADLGISGDKLHLTGNPVMKLYDQPYKDYFKGRRQLARAYGLDPDRKWVLFPENYRWAFLSPGQMAAFVAQDASPEHLTAAREYCVRSLTRLFEWLQDLNSPDDPLVVLRPRPATAEDEMTAFMNNAAPRGCPNLRVIKGESAREWILAADHVISSYSTTLIESSLAGKPLHVFSPEPFPEALEDEWYEYAPCLRSAHELLGAIRGPGSRATSTRLEQWARKVLLPAGDPLQIIAERIAALRASLPDPGRRSTPDRNRLWRGQILIETARKQLQTSPRYHDFLRKRDRRYAFTLHKHEKDIFGADDVAKRVAHWRALARQPGSGATQYSSRPSDERQDRARASF
jgi:surface carbohydrate biosynthesis protein